MTILAINHLSVDAWGAKLLGDINLQVKAGQILAIIGPNGAGKTTLLNTIRNSIKPTNGSIEFCGLDIGTWPAVELARHMAVLPQQSALSFPFSVLEVIQLGRTPHASGVATDHEIALQVAQMLDISHLLDRPYTRLSGGEKQRVQLARVMAQIWRSDDAKQRLLLLDEPTAALDIGHQQQLMQLIVDFAAQGVAVVMVMHDIDLAASFATQMLALSCGRSIAQGAADQVVVPHVLKSLFGVDIGVLQHPDTGRPLLLKQGVLNS